MFWPLLTSFPCGTSLLIVNASRCSVSAMISTVLTASKTPAIFVSTGFLRWLFVSTLGVFSSERYTGKQQAESRGQQTAMNLPGGDLRNSWQSTWMENSDGSGKFQTCQSSRTTR